MRRATGLAAAFLLCAARADARPPSGLGVLRVLGPRAESVLAPRGGGIDALVAIPSGKTARDLGLVEIAPGVGRISGSGATLLSFGAAHPDAHLEIGTPLHTLLANAQLITRAKTARLERGATGAGAAVGIIDTGIDPTLPDFRDPTTQKSRIAWMLDLSMKPLGLHPELEQKFGIFDDNNNLVQGAVLSGADIDDLIAQGKPLPEDVNGHGTHVASIAAGNGGGTPFVGMAPEAALVVARITRDSGDSLGTNDTLTGVSFVFDRAENDLHVPLVANLSLGTDFGPHDGNSLWEQTLASFVGPDHPGRAIAAAAGNSGSIVDTPIHQGVAVTGTHVSVPVCVGACDTNAQASAVNGAVQIWVALRAGSDMRIGLDGPDGTWISPIADEHEQGHTSGAMNSGVIYGSDVPNTLIPKNSHGAIVIWTGTFSSGRYAITLEGSGFADLYVEGIGEASLSSSTPAYFPNAVREATVTMPASSPAIIAVGCTIDNPSWVSLGQQKIGITEPVLDAYGGLSQGQRVSVANGEVCYFSSAGPTLAGVPKPDILAPGAVVIGAMSQKALPGSPTSIFTTDCPPKKGTNQVDPACMEIDSRHAVALGTSMSSPMAAGIIALLFQQNALLTQDQVRALLQAGAQHVRGPAPFFDQEGPGEVDALGALDALAEMAQPDAAIPDASKSWMTLSEDYAVADGSTPLTATLELRTSTNTRATLFDSSRLQPIALLGSMPLPAMIVRGGAPGLFRFTVTIPPGRGDEALTLGATFDGAFVVPPVAIPVATDAWTAGYPPYVGGGCSAARSATGNALPALALLALLALRRRTR